VAQATTPGTGRGAQALAEQERGLTAIAADLFTAAFRRHGVEVLIGQSIPTQLYLSGEQAGLREVLARTEMGGSIMAYGYARASGRVPVSTSLAGPATFLTMAGLGEAYHASIPMISILQDVPRPHRDRNFAQEANDLHALQAVTKLARRVERADRIEDYVDLAFVTAASGRPGPVALLVAPDMLEEPVRPEGTRTARYGAYPLDRTLADPAAIRAAADLLARAHLPVIVAGGGVHSSQATEELGWFQDGAGIPVGTTMMGKGTVADDHELSLGVLGYTMGKNAPSHYNKALLDEADVILFIGSRTNQNGTNTWTVFPPSARYLHLDVDGAEVGRNYEALRLVGDAKLTLAALRAELEGGDLSVRAGRRADIVRRVAEGRARQARDSEALLASSADPIRPERVMAELDRVLTPDTTVCADASYATVWAATYLKSRRRGARFLTPRGLAGIGWGFPMALGAKLGCPEHPLVNISGDGGFGYGWSEMETAVRNKLPMLQIVLNNGVLAYQRDAEDASYGRHTPGLHFAPVDHAAIARACGWNGMRIEKAGDLAEAMRAGLASDQPTLVEVMTDTRAWPPIQNYEGKI
jgi:acetolactate synthase-1/2/3 large subunit